MPQPGISLRHPGKVDGKHSVRMLFREERGEAGVPSPRFYGTPANIAAAVRPRGRRKLKPAWWAPSGFAAIPTAALDPAHSPASPAVPALIGSGSPLK